RRAVERFDGASVIDVHDRVELPRERCAKVMARALGAWTIDDADRALEAHVVPVRAIEARAGASPGSPRAGKRPPPPRASGHDALALDGAVPVRRRAHRPFVRRRADEERVAVPSLAGQLSNVVLARFDERGRARVPDV